MNCALAATAPATQKSKVWQLPSLATPQNHRPDAPRGLRGRNLELVEQRVLKRLKQSGIRLDILPIEGMGSALTEETALRLRFYSARSRRCAIETTCASLPRA